MKLSNSGVTFANFSRLIAVKVRLHFSKYRRKEGGGREGGGVGLGKKKKPPNSTLSFKIFLGMPQQR